MSEHQARVRWQRNGAVFTDQRYSRAHRWNFDGGAEIAAAASPQVVAPSLTDASAIDPEEAFVASISSCHMLWFLSLAAAAGVRIDSYDDWLSRFETAMRLLPEAQRAESMLAILDPYRQPQRPTNKSALPADRFQAATAAAGRAIPPVTAELIGKYVADLRHLELL